VTDTASPPIGLVARSLLRADGIVLARNHRALLLSLGAPLILLVATNNKSVQHLGGALFVIGLCIAIGLLNTSILGYALTVVKDRDEGIFQRLRLTPAPSWTILASRLTIQVIANALLALVVAIIGGLLHHLSLSAAQYGLVVATSIVGGAVFLAIGQATVGLIRSADTVNAATRLLLVALLFLGLFGQSGALGHTWESIARWSPVGAVMTLFAGILNLSRWDSRDTLTLIACAAYIAVSAIVGIRWFRWEPR